MGLAPPLPSLLNVIDLESEKTVRIQKQLHAFADCTLPTQNTTQRDLYPPPQFAVSKYAVYQMQYIKSYHLLCILTTIF